MELLEIAKMGPKIVAAGAKELAELAGKTPNADALAAKVAPTPVKAVRTARARAAAEGATSGPGPAPVKRRTRKPADPAPAPVSPAPRKRAPRKKKVVPYTPSRETQQRVESARVQAHFKRKAAFTVGMKQAEAEAATARSKKLQRTAAQVAGGTAAAGAATAAAVTARRARSLRHVPAPGLNPSQKAVVGVGAGAAGGMLLASRRRES